jgi:hypothetical protein
MKTYKQFNESFDLKKLETQLIKDTKVGKYDIDVSMKDKDIVIKLSSSVDRDIIDKVENQAFKLVRKLGFNKQNFSKGQSHVFSF